MGNAENHIMNPPGQNDVSSALGLLRDSLAEAKQRAFLTHLHATLNTPSHPIPQRLDRIRTASPDLLAIIKQEGRA